MHFGLRAMGEGSGNGGGRRETGEKTEQTK